MPPHMRMMSTPTGSIETGNKLGARPCIRQSQLYREQNGGNAVKDLLGQPEIMWDTQQQEGVFRGMAVHRVDAGLPGRYQSSRGEAGETASVGGSEWRTQCHPHTLAAAPAIADWAADGVDRYPEPGSSATCDGCGSVVRTFWHCGDCCEPELFDLCARCYAGVYEHRGAAADLARLRKVPRITNPAHDLARHRMVHVRPRSFLK